jgi:predicted lipoprotein with Yx(FWY)xxD motif
MVLVFAVSLAAGAVLPTVKTAKNAELGTILVNSTGRTLYHITTDAGRKVTCAGSCATLWPPLVVAAGVKPVAGTGITAAKLGVIKRSDGSFQVTYNGMTLYRYSGDAKAGQTNGEGIASKWFAVSASSGGGLGSSGYGTTGSSPSTSTTSSSPGYNNGY